MIIGHVGVALAAKGRWRSASLGWLLTASFAPDIWRAILGAHGYPLWESTVLSHILPAVLVLAVVLASLAWLVMRQGTTAILVAVLVLSHVALDFVSGWKPLWVGGPTGLDLQHVEQLELLLEAAICWAGWRMLPRQGVHRAFTHPAFMVLLLAGEIAYLSNTWLLRPPDMQCVMYPVAPCSRRP